MGYNTEDLLSQLKTVRQDAGISQRALSARSGLTQSHISLIETGALEPGLSSLVEISRALDLELMLVPKTLVPAIRGLLQGVGGQRSLSPTAAKATARDIDSGERLAAKLIRQHGRSAELDRIVGRFRQLRQSAIGPTDAVAIRHAVERLRRYRPGEEGPESLQGLAETLPSLRARQSGPADGGPRPAYTLDADDEDA